jgi:arylsulfatase A-like enzyme
MSWFGATLLGFSCRWPSAWVQAAVERRRWLATAGAILGVLALVGVGLPLSNSQRVDLTLWDANLLPDVALGRTAFAKSQSASAESNPFFLPTGQAPAVPPRPQQLLPKDGVVLLLSIDGIRADVVGPEKKQLFPNLYRLYENGTHFSNVWSPGSATVYTLSAVSTGETFSERYWTKTKGDYWPYEDRAVHFPALLTAAGISTLHARSTSWLENGRHLMSGFQEERYPKTDWKWVKGKELADALISMLGKHESGPVFAFAHFLDTHHPYRPGRKKSKSPFEQYLYSLSYVDKQLGRVLDALNDYGMADRVIVIVTADHGEAFGEHGTHAHATSLYEEQVRVPLVFWGPTIPKQERSEHVTLLDLGPTVLELFRQTTPGAFLGQSLVPALEGKELALQRPIIAEARLLQSMVFDDGIKVIRNRKSGVVEVYDLNEDPKEADNLSDEDAGRFQPRVDRLIQFFDAHTLRRPGYRVPLRK